MESESFKKEMMRKYQWAGKIRFVSFFLLLVFSWFMKLSSSTFAIQIAFTSIVIAEAFINQPYRFFLKRVNVHRFQFYQMVIDIIVISGIVYYMGGIQAPIISLAYYAVILWAGVVSGMSAVFFAAVVSAVCFSVVVVFEYAGILPSVSYLGYKMPGAQFYSLLLGNVSFLFAFGYFSARSSRIIKYLERKHQEESLCHTHKFLAIGYLINSIIHDIVNNQVAIKGYVNLVSDKIRNSDKDKAYIDCKKELERIDALSHESIQSLSSVSRFSQKSAEVFSPVRVQDIVSEALHLVSSLARMSSVAIQYEFDPQCKVLEADREELVEVFVTYILHMLVVMPKKEVISIRAHHNKEKDCIQVVLSATGIHNQKEYVMAARRSLHDMEENGQFNDVGLMVAHQIVARHRGILRIYELSHREVAYVLQFPLSVGV